MRGKIRQIVGDITVILGQRLLQGFLTPPLLCFADLDVLNDKLRLDDLLLLQPEYPSYLALPFFHGLQDLGGKQSLAVTFVEGPTR